MFSQKAFDQLLVEVDTQEQASGVELLVPGLAAIDVTKLFDIARAALYRTLESRAAQGVIGTANLDDDLPERLLEGFQTQPGSLIGNRQFHGKQIVHDDRRAGFAKTDYHHQQRYEFQQLHVFIFSLARTFKFKACKIAHHI